MNKKRASKTSPENIVPWTQLEILEQLPFNVAIIDRDFNIIHANNEFLEHFGQWRGKKCYEAYKKLDSPCSPCNALNTFKDGDPKVADEVGIDLRGRPTHYVVHTAPLKQGPNKPVEFVLEMSTDVTETKRWQQEYQILFERVPCYITVIDEEFRIIRANAAFREQFGDAVGEKCYKIYKRRNKKCPQCPAAKTFLDGLPHRSNQVGANVKGERTYYQVTTSPLRRGSNRVAHVIEISTDITDVKKLEEEMIEAERLAAVGQTVAGLAHSIKNILMGLDGGKYIVGLGLQKNERAMIDQGWEMLERNFNKMTTLVKDFLSFAKGRLPEVRWVEPNDLIKEIVDLYREVAKQKGIDLNWDIDPKVKKTPLDPDAIHTCLTNLVSNAIDACEMSEKKDRYVTIRSKRENGLLVFEVIDNGVGMDAEVKRKIFTTFFTTKGGEGTGLGLLTTRKIVQEHGGKITVKSRPGEGVRFRIELPRKRLLKLLKITSKNEQNNLS
jgi:PAS domain S-box-containing protein